MYEQSKSKIILYGYDIMLDACNGVIHHCSTWYHHEMVK